MRRFVRAAIVTMSVAFSSHAGSQEIKARADACALPDLKGNWLMIFQRAGKPEMCFIEISNKGRVKATNPCSIENSLVPSYAISGKIAIANGCRIGGTLKPSLGSDFGVTAQIIGTKDFIAGVLTDDTGDFFPVTFTRFD